MTATENISRMKLKIRIGSKQIGANPGTKHCELGQGLVLDNECSHSSPSICKSHNSVIPPSDALKFKISSMGSNKRGLSVVVDGQKEKKRKMDRSVTQQCAVLLKQLMSHPAGWVFNQPVDPIKLQIPDYYQIISHPMDLGTVKIKLNNNEYSSVDEFAAHVRLTFSNAMRYNPPDNNVHYMAKELNDLFDSEWNALNAKWNGGRKILLQRQISGVVKCTNNSGNNGNKNLPSYMRMEPKTLLSDVEKQKLREQLLELARRKVPSHLQGFLKKVGFDLQRIERIGEVVDALGDEDLGELRKIMSSGMVQTAEVASAKEPERASQQSRVKITHKGIDNGIGSASGSVNIIPPPNLVTRECDLCHNMSCECNKQSDKAHASSDLLSEGSRDYLDVSVRDCATKLHSNSQLSKSEPKSEGAGVSLNEEHVSSCPPVLTAENRTASAEECASVVDVQLSPQKALRAALLKSRFADTILKAKQKALRDHGDKVDPMKLQLEKERLERQQQEERARIEAQIRASEEAARMRTEAERKMQREREREAARLALQQMVKTVEIVNDHKILEDLEQLSGCSLSDQLSCGSCESSPGVSSGEKVHFVKALEQLGLFMKDDYLEDEDEDDIIIISGRGHGEEEGEICP